jgi:CheY-like chemotaxis protein
MFKEVQPEIGFQSADARSASEIASRLESIGLAAVRKRFTPEFVNRLDVVVTYRPLDADSLAQILEAHIAELQRHVHTRLGERSFEIDVRQPARQVLLEKGSSPEYGARELKRTIHRLLTQPLASAVAGGQVEPGGRVIVDLAEDGNTLKFQFEPGEPLPEVTARAPVVLILDDNTDLLDLLRRGFDRAGMTPITATTAEEARQIATREAIDLALIDIMLPDGDGLSVAFEFVRRWPGVRVVLMTGAELTTDEIALCERQDFPILRKPFLLTDVTSLVKASALGPRRPARNATP